MASAARRVHSRLRQQFRRRVGVHEPIDCRRRPAEREPETPEEIERCLDTAPRAVAADEHAIWPAGVAKSSPSIARAHGPATARLWPPLPVSQSSKSARAERLEQAESQRSSRRPRALVHIPRDVRFARRRCPRASATCRYPIAQRVGDGRRRRAHAAAEIAPASSGSKLPSAAPSLSHSAEEGKIVRLLRHAASIASL